MITYLALLALLLVAAAADIARLRIPNVVCAAIAVLFSLSALMAGGDIDFIAHFGAAALVFLFGWGLFAFGAMGGGDVKLFAATALWVGFDLLIPHLVYVALLGLVVLAILFLARYLAGIATQRLSLIRAESLPCSLLPGKGVPYGVAISSATVLLMERMPANLWLPH